LKKVLKDKKIYYLELVLAIEFLNNKINLYNNV
jgi:hypothetical protein